MSSSFDLRTKQKCFQFFKFSLFQQSTSFISHFIEVAIINGESFVDKSYFFSASTCRGKCFHSLEILQFMRLNFIKKKIGPHVNIHKVVSIMFVVYFDQQTGASHAVCWSKSIFNAKTTFCVLLSHYFVPLVTEKFV